ncbi:MAG: type II toxin-antitoxin system RelE/ParE family toxin [Bacteroidetes bacterium]|nr:type II toxin-antitoxin system RelE/ParE family toxin [Bacteroidota bacterium]
MKFSVVILPEAKQDLKLAALWYNKQKKGLGSQFLLRVRESKKVLQNNPHFFKRYKNVHTLPLRQFPFMIHFTINDSHKTVAILAVLHTSQHPDKWPNQ